MPLGSVLGQVLFILYTKPLSDLIKHHSIESQSFVETTKLKVSVAPLNIQSAVSFLETCLQDIQAWMLKNKLKLQQLMSATIPETGPLLLHYHGLKIWNRTVWNNTGSTTNSRCYTELTTGR